MADDPRSVASGGGPPHDGMMEARIAVLEQIAADTRDALREIRAEIRESTALLRAEMSELRAEIRGEIRSLRSDQRSDFRTLLALILGLGGITLTGGLGMLGVMAKGFHWLN